jgi:hypothetical protein
MKHFISLSGGTASAVAADRVLTRYGRNDTVLWFADTMWEDEDLYRFLSDLEAYWEKTIVRYTNGQTPLEVASKKSIIPNNKIAPCSLELKIKPGLEFVAKLAKEGPVTVHMGLDFTEMHRGAKPKESYESIEGVSFDLPLLWKPIANPPHRKVTESWGIKTPRLYDLGFPHNNCGGRCVRQGIREWVRLKATFPERFKEVKEWEAAQRAKGGPRAKYSIAKNQSGSKVFSLPLDELERRYAQGQQLFLGSEPSQEDAFGCFCGT